MGSKWVLNLIVASLLAFSIYMGFGMILPLLPLYVKELDGGGLAVGVLMASFMFTRAFLATPFGRLSDRVGRKKVIVSGMFLYAFLAFLFTVPDQWWGLLIVRVLQGTASAMVWPAGEALIVDSAPPERRGRAISIYMLFTNAGIVAGPLLGGAVLYYTQEVLGLGLLGSYRVPFYFTSAISLAGAFLGLFLLRNVLSSVDVKGRRTEERKAMASMKGRLRRSLDILYVNSFVEGFSFSMVGVVMVFFMTAQFGLLARDFSILVGAAQGLAMGVIVLTGILADRYGRKPVMVAGSLFSSLSTLALSSTPLLPWGKGIALVTYTLREMGIQSAAPAMRALQADLVPEAVRGRLIGTLHQFNNLGAVIGPVLGGLMWDMFEGKVFILADTELPADVLPFLLSAVLLALAAIMVFAFVHEPKRPEISGENR